MSITCRAVTRQLALHRWGEALAPALRAHLERCARCRELARADEVMWERLGDLEALPVPARLRARVLGSLPEEPRAGWLASLHALRLGSPALLSALLLLVVVGAGMGVWVGDTLAGDAAPARPQVRLALEPESGQLFDAEPPGFVSGARLLATMGGRDAR